MLGKGRAEKIGDRDIAMLADEMGVHPADLEAISKVESNGFGWFKDGRIKILFEKHWFYKLVGSENRDKAVSQSLARRNWISPKKGGYKDQSNASARYRLLEKAIALNEEAAYQSISVGKYQIMGFNHGICGFISAKQMFIQFCDSEKNQLRAFANFLRSKGLVGAIRDRDFNRVEEVYNGGGLGGAYARRMKAESNKLRAGKWKDYKARGLPTPVEPAEQDAILKRGSKGPFVRELQLNLVALGYSLVVDGDYGIGTETAVMAFQRANGLKVDGWAGPRTIDAVGRAVAEMKSKPKIEKAAEQAKGKAKEEVEKKTGIWQWIIGVFSSGALGGLGALGGVDWQTIAAIGGVVVAFLIILLVLRRQIIGAVKDIKNAVEGDA